MYSSKIHGGPSITSAIEQPSHIIGFGIRDIMINKYTLGWQAKLK